MDLTNYYSQKIDSLIQISTSNKILKELTNFYFIIFDNFSENYFF